MLDITTEAGARVDSLNLNSNAHGKAVVRIEGAAEIVEDFPPASPERWHVW